MPINLILNDINRILQNHGLSLVLQPHDLLVTPNSVSDALRDGNLSDAITQHLWPTVSAATVCHYTSVAAAESILKSGVFRLTNIEKRHEHGEIETFCKTHGLNGYLDPDPKNMGLPKYRSLLMPQLYYASFTKTNLSSEDEEYFWRNFGRTDGVRLTFEVRAENPNFRKIVYEPSLRAPIPLLFELASTIRQRHKREFILGGISRLCAFYLCGKKWAHEQEYRALFKSWPDGETQPNGSGPNSYIEVPLNQMTDVGYEFRVVEVHAHYRPNIPNCYPFSKRSQR